MANENTTSIQDEVTAANTVVVPTPEPGQAVTVTLQAEQIPQINFDPGTESTQEFVGTDLVFTLDNGAVLTFVDFAANINDGEVTSIMLEDGSIIPIDALVAAWNLEVPETAAGEAPASGGSSAYVDDMGDALGGIDKLGVQDPDTFDAGAPQVVEDEQQPLPAENLPPDALNDLADGNESVTIDEDTQATGNVLANTVDPDGGPASVVDFSVDGTTYNAGQTATIANVGALTIAADGGYTFTPLADYNGPVPQATYTVTDGIDTVTSTLDIAITPVNDVPVVGNASATVSEEGLLDGIPDTVGSPSDVSDSVTFTGNIAVSDADGDSLSLTLEDPPVDGEFTSNGVAVTWTGSGTNTLTGMAGSTPVATISIASNGDYTVTLKGPIDHPGVNVEDVASFDVTVRASDGFQSSTGTLTVHIEDDSPSIGNVPNAVITAEAGVELVADTGFKSGADSNGAALTFSAAATSVDADGFIKASYEHEGETLSSYLTFGGSKLKYTEAEDGSLTAKTADGTTDVYSISADPATGEYTLQMHETLDALQVFAQFSTSDISGSNSDFYLITGMSNDNGNVGVELKASAYDADDNLMETVNTRDDFFGVGGGQDVANNDKGDNDTLVLEFAKADSWDSSTGDPVDGAFESANLSTINFSTIAFGAGEQLSWTAYLDGNVAASGTIDGTGSDTSSSNLQEYSLGPLEVGSLFDTIEFSAAEGTSYKIGGINILVADGTLDQSTGVTLVGTDADNDATAVQTINLTFSSNETLQGSSGEDVITGGSGDDMITGGLGNDILVGGEGEDVFLFTAQGGEGSNTLADFNVGDGYNVGGDVLSFTDLLDLDEDSDIDGDDLALFTDSVTVANDGTDLTLTIPNVGDPGSPTIVTLAGVGADYDSGFSGSLTELINTVDSNGNQINIDTFAT